MVATPQEQEDQRKFEQSLTPQQRRVYDTLREQQSRYERWASNINTPQTSLEDYPAPPRWEALLGKGLGHEGGAGLSPAQVELFRKAHTGAYLGWREANDGSGGWGRWDPPKKLRDLPIFDPGELIDPPREHEFKLPRKTPEGPLIDPSFDPEYKFKPLPYVIEPGMSPAERLREKFLRLQPQQEQAYLKVLGYETGALTETAKNKDQIAEAKRKFAEDNGIDPKNDLAINKALREKILGSEVAAKYLESVQTSIRNGTATKDDVRTAQWLLKGQERDMPLSQRPDGTMDGVPGRETRTALPAALTKIRLALAEEMIPIGIGAGFPDLHKIAGKLSAATPRALPGAEMPGLLEQSLMGKDELQALLQRPNAAAIESGAPKDGGPVVRGTPVVKADSFKP